MRRLRNHHGVTLVELLMAIFLSSIALGLAAQMLTLFITSSQSTIIASQANLTGNLIASTIETRLRNMSPTSYSTCPGETNCIIAIQNYQYLIDETGITIDYFDTPNTLEISFADGQISLLREIGTPLIMDLNGFELKDTSTIIVLGSNGTPVDGEKVTLIFEFVLIAKDKEYPFTASYSFEIDLS